VGLGFSIWENFQWPSVFGGHGSKWKNPEKIWVGVWEPLHEQGHASTTSTLWNGRNTPFWYAPWSNGRKPIEIAPLIFASSKRKNWKYSQALHEQIWVIKIDLTRPFTLEHFSQFVELWSLIANFNLRGDQEDDFVCRLTPNGEYSTISAYEVQFLGSITSPTNKYIWKAWVHPKVMFFACLAS
jgi:hypothetical protein